MRASPTRLLGAVLLVTAAAISSLPAQESFAAIRGSVVDPGGIPLPGISVRLVDAGRDVRLREVVTDLEGRFNIPFLSPSATYLLRIEHPGYAAMEIGPIRLTAGQTTVQDLRLQSSEDLSEHIQVEAEGTIVDIAGTETSTVFNTEFIEGLPLIGRSYSDLLTLTAGVTDTDGDGNPNVQGARDTGLQYRLDGSNITDPLSGNFGQNVSFDVIEELEVVTGGATAEFGRADGGFANIITKSGSNLTEGSTRLFWRGRFLDGDGATENADTIHAGPDTVGDLRNLSLNLTLGGPIKRDRLWYFASFQHDDLKQPLNLAGLSLTRESRGYNLFAKLTWQINLDNRLSLQHLADPSESRGELLDFGIDPESDAVIARGARTTQLRWTSIISPTLLMEARLAYYNAGVSFSPLSDEFHVIEIEKAVVREGSETFEVALFPWHECIRRYCDGPYTIYQIDLIHGTAHGPFPNATNDDRTRASLRADLDRAIETEWGEHRLKSGFEFAEERFRDDPITNAFFIDHYRTCEEICQAGARCPDECVAGIPPQLIPGWTIGFQVLVNPTPVRLEREVQGFNISTYLQDSWLALPNVSIHAGLRIDHETIDTAGFTEFDPRDEKRRQIAILEGLCNDGIRVARFGDGRSNADLFEVCDDPGRTPGEEPRFNLKYWMDENTPERLRQHDINRDGIFDAGLDGPVWREALTTFEERKPESFSLSNLNLAPRVSLSWDPWADGRTKLFTTWGRYYDRLFLDTADDEMGPDSVNYLFVPGLGFRGASFLGTSSVRGGAANIIQVERQLRTPFTDVFTLGFERELAPEWAMGVTYTQRLGWDLLQDVDLNHVECEGFPIEFDIKKRQVCALFTDSNGKVHLSRDRFGTVIGNDGKPSKRNGAPDLYVVNPNFNQVLRVGNFNSSNYRSVTLELRRRLHRNWQANLTYTWSRAIGQAEEFLSTLGNDPSTRDDEVGLLDYDQEHRVILVGTGHFPRDIQIGASITWESGTPFSSLRQVAEQDDDLNILFRTFYPTDRRNDQRNGGFWGVNLKVEKRFNLGETAAMASLAVNNLLNDDDVTLRAFRTRALNGIQLEEGPQGLRRFGRIWELGFTLAF